MRLTVHKEGAGEPLVLLHGLGSSSRSWAPVRHALAQRHEVHAIDLPGFGGSTPLRDGLAPTPLVLADAVERALDRLGLDAPHLCGNSLGGWIALELAYRGRARSVVAISPAGMWTERERRYVRASLRLSHRLARPLAPVASRAMASRLRRSLFFAQIRRRPWTLPKEDAASDLEMTARRPAFPATLEATMARRAQNLGAIRCPVLLLWGTRDLLLLPRQAERFAAAIPGARLRWLDGLGHIPMSDDPRRVAEAILEHTTAAEAVAAEPLPT